MTKPVPIKSPANLESTDIEDIDGRRQRSARSRAAIITASLTLLDNGNLSPTAKQIAEEAGVGLRSFFRHFEDMDALLDAVDRQTRAHYEKLFPLSKSDGPLEERLSEFISVLSNAFERLKRPMQFAQFQMWQSKALQRNWSRNQQLVRDNFEAWVPELGRLSHVKREAAFAAVSFDMWQRLRVTQNLSINDAHDAILTILRGLLDEGQ